MPTKLPRVNITLDEAHLGMLSLLAGKRGSSVSATAKELILAALELQEDMHFSELAHNREKTTQKWRSHDDVWK